MGNWRLEDAGHVIPVLTLDPIWAWAIANANKRIENRSWTTSYRGPFWVHAGAHQRAPGYEDASVTIRANTRGRLIPSPARLPISQVIALAMLEGSEVSPTEVTKCEPWEQASVPGSLRPNYGWRISVLHRLECPISGVSGSQGFWKLRPEDSAKMSLRVQEIARLSLRLAYVKGKGEGDGSEAQRSSGGQSRDEDGAAHGSDGRGNNARSV